MKKFLKNDLLIIIILLFIVLIFKNNIIFKNCIISCCQIFFYQVLPTLLPMFIINDLLISYNFIFYLNKILEKVLFKLFRFSNAATYIFTMSLLSGTPTNGYITANLVKSKNLNIKDASIILSYSFFLNPLFLYNMLNNITNNNSITIKIILITYSMNLIIAFFNRKYQYTNIEIPKNSNNSSFSLILTNSISYAFSTLTNILGTMIFYFILCEGINILFKSPFMNCFSNGLLEVTGGLSKLKDLNLSLFCKEIIGIIFISFGGLSIHSQIKSIISDAGISYKKFFKARIIHVFLSIITLILSKLI